MLTATVNRVRDNTSDCVNQAIDQATEARVRRISQGGPHAIQQRLDELDREWDIERLLETVAPTLSLTGLALGVLRDRRFLLVPLVVQAFFLQHAIQGWCPPMPVLRRLGVRTAEEISQERNALKALRGDYQSAEMKQPNSAQRAVEAARS